MQINESKPFVKGVENAGKFESKIA